MKMAEDKELKSRQNQAVVRLSLPRLRAHAARLAFKAGKLKRPTTQEKSFSGGGLFGASESDSDDSSVRRRRLIGRLDEASMRCSVAA